MSQFQVKQKFNVKNKDFFIEVMSFTSQSQGVRLNLQDANYYTILINGHSIVVAEYILAMFVEENKENKNTVDEIAKGMGLTKEEEKFENIFEDAEVVPTKKEEKKTKKQEKIVEKKSKRGRPKKK